LDEHIAAPPLQQDQEDASLLPAQPLEGGDNNEVEHQQVNQQGEQQGSQEVEQEVNQQGEQQGNQEVELQGEPEQQALGHGQRQWVPNARIWDGDHFVPERRPGPFYRNQATTVGLMASITLSSRTPIPMPTPRVISQGTATSRMMTHEHFCFLTGILQALIQSLHNLRN
jgi:hypothetical protein